MSLSQRVHVNQDGSAEFQPGLPSDGIHVFRFDKGIKLSEPGEFGQSIFVPLTVDDKNDPDNGSRTPYFVRVAGDDVGALKRAESDFITLLVQVGLDGEVERAFNDPPYLFDSKILPKLVEMLSVMLPDRHIKLETRQAKDGKKCYIVNSWALGQTTTGTTTAPKTTGTTGKSGPSWG